MILEQHYLACLSQASYIVGDGETLAIIDPRRDVDLYLERASALGGKIRHVLLTHFHADFLAGHLELVARTGATLYLGAAAKADFPFTPLADGDELALGELRLRALATPGHTPESTCYLLLKEDGEPHAVFTGDTLFVGDVGRPDLMTSKGVTGEELARSLHHSLQSRLLTLPDSVLVMPGHGAGSSCGKNLSSETTSTIGAQRTNNAALGLTDVRAFVAELTEGQPPAPPYFGYTATLNQRVHGLLEEVLPRALVPLTLDALQAHAARGAQILDTRPKEAYAAGHLEGCLWVGLDGQFASWAGCVLDLERPVVLIAEAGKEREAALRLGRIGFDRVEGFLAESKSALAAADLVPARRSSPKDTASALAAGRRAPRVLDVRQPGEVAEGHIPGAITIPLGQLKERLSELPQDAERGLHVHCKSGWRSLVALSVLEAAGRSDVVDIPGGMMAWEAAGCPIEGRPVAR